MAGYRSALPLLGISAPVVVVQAGYRSLLGLWIGGVSSGFVPPIPPIPPVPSLTYEGHPKRWRPIVEDVTTKRIFQDEEDIIMFLATFTKP